MVSSLGLQILDFGLDKTIVIVLAMERAPTAPTSQPPAVTTPQRGRPKPPEPKRPQAAAPPAA